MIFKKWLKESLEINQKNYDKFPLSSLLIFAKKFNNFNDFSNWYSLQVNHGYYWHLTENKNFSILNNVAPRDMSSLVNTQKNNSNNFGDLMLTSHLDHWDDFYNTDHLTGKREIARPYAALFDASKVPPEKLVQNSRGFGNEIYLRNEDAQKLKLIGVYDIKYAKQLDKKFENLIPHSKNELFELWVFANGI